MFVLRRIVELAFSPFGILAAVLWSGLLIALLRPKAKLGKRLLAIGVFLYLATIFTPLSEVLIGTLERDYEPLLHPDPTAGIGSVVVLSGYGEQNPGIPVTSDLSSETQCRITEGIRLYRRLPGAKMIFSGGVMRGGDKSVGRLMADFARDLGIPEQDLLVEGRSRNTWENLLEVREMVGSRPFILVTSACDLRRAMAVARKLEMTPVAAPSCIWSLQYLPAGLSRSEWTRRILGAFLRPDLERLPYLQRAYHEYVGFLWYKILGRV